MSECTNPVLDQDGEYVCRCGDEGRPCAACEDAEAAYWLAQYRVAPLAETNPRQYELDMRDAGRAHLLLPE